MNRADAIQKIKSTFAAYRAVAKKDSKLMSALSAGKLYELYVLSELLRDLTTRGMRVAFQGTSLKFKAAPGHVDPADPHFVVLAPDGTHFFIFVDIEFLTLGRHRAMASDLSDRHELDIVVIRNSHIPVPTFSDIALAVECKCVAKFSKRIIKETLGVRRELSVLAGPAPSMLTTARASRSVYVNASPPSEFWLAYIDAAGNNYSRSPSAFSIELRHIEP